MSKILQGHHTELNKTLKNEKRPKHRQSVVGADNSYTVLCNHNRLVIVH